MSRRDDKRLHLGITKQMAEAIRNRAKREGVTPSEWVRSTQGGELGPAAGYYGRPGSPRGLLKPGTYIT